jgi:hypothetical protein
MDHATLYAAREYVPADQQGLISPYEHRAFAREATAENPWMALPIAAGTLAYQPYKMVMGARSGASLDQVKQGLTGVGEGLWGALQQATQSTPARTADTGTPTSSTGLLESLRDYLQATSTPSTPHR